MKNPFDKNYVLSDNELNSRVSAYDSIKNVAWYIVVVLSILLTALLDYGVYLNSKHPFAEVVITTILCGVAIFGILGVISMLILSVFSGYYKTDIFGETDAYKTLLDYSVESDEDYCNYLLRDMQRSYNYDDGSNQYIKNVMESRPLRYGDYLVWVNIRVSYSENIKNIEVIEKFKKSCLELHSS